MPVDTDKMLSLLDSFQGGANRADKALFAHAVARQMDVLTTDGGMKKRSLKELFIRLQRLQDSQLPSWYIPEIEVVRGNLHS
jgi:hypothetical protein